MTNKVPDPPKTKEELDAWIKELEKPVLIKSGADIKREAKRTVTLTAVRYMISMNADPDLFWMTIEALWRKYHN